MRNAFLACAVAVGTALAASVSSQTPQFDLLVKNGRIVDGTGAAWFLGDVAIRGDRIARAGSANSQIGRAHV